MGKAEHALGAREPRIELLSFARGFKGGVEISQRKLNRFGNSVPSTDALT